eukprot:TRINITY_DN6816_c0_g1_i1.p1 TRINITY_DN6816_c0_g1~~TRINITY_DN6816_c0_g1_i1.p1  ORF type:complete len:511 (+),score=55.75 TRINITY_DN6816_c0_g1_i1:896-2428(+)
MTGQPDEGLISSFASSHEDPNFSVDTWYLASDGSLSFRAVFFVEGKLISPWHQIPRHVPRGTLTPSGTLRCVCTIPAGTWVEHGLATTESFTPLFVKRTSEENGALVPSHFSTNAPAHKVFLPQTAIADFTPTAKTISSSSSANQNALDGSSAQLSAPVSDNGGLSAEGEGALLTSSFQPLEAIDISADVSRVVGEVYLVKSVGLLLYGDGEESCKLLLVIAADDPMEAFLRDMRDLQTLKPRILEVIRIWLDESCTRLAAGSRQSPTPSAKAEFKDLRAADAVLQIAKTAWEDHFSPMSHPPSNPELPESIVDAEEYWGTLASNKFSPDVTIPLRASCALKLAPDPFSRGPESPGNQSGTKLAAVRKVAKGVRRFFPLQLPVGLASESAQQTAKRFQSLVSSSCPTLFKPDGDLLGRRETTFVVDGTGNALDEDDEEGMDDRFSRTTSMHVSARGGRLMASLSANNWVKHLPPLVARTPSSGRPPLPTPTPKSTRLKTSLDGSTTPVTK